MIENEKAQSSEKQTNKVDPLAAGMTAWKSFIRQ